MALVEEMLLEPRWDEEQFSLNQTRTVNNLKRSLADPNYLARMTSGSLMIGTENVFSTDVSGTVESVEAITMDDLKGFYANKISPSVADFLIVGDVDQVKVEKALAGLNERWIAKEVTMPAFTFPPVPEKASLHFVDVPGAKQSVISIGCLSLTRDNPDYYKAEVANYKLGGSFNGIVNMVLREEKGFTYGAHSYFNARKSYGTFTATSSVRSDATLESVQLFKDIMLEYRAGVPQEYVDFTKGSLLKANALRFETIEAKLGMLSTMTFYDLPMDYIKQEEDYLRGLTVEQVNETVQKYIDPMRMYYVVVGDAATQLKGLVKAGLGDPVLVK